MEGTPFGRYQLLELLRRGGMGEVWRAYDTTARRVVALKVLPASFADDQKYRQRFLREAYAAAGLSDPHVVPIHNFGEIDGRLYVDMRLIDGRDLDAVLADGPLDPARAVTIVEQVASALNAAHKAGLVHRDVKPSNILISENDFAYLIDFGIARAGDETRLTSPGGVVGSVAYMAPEQWRAHADSRTDVYALACVLHECLTGAQPFDGASIEQQYTAHTHAPPPRPSTVRPGLPTGLDDVICKGMAKDPEQRYQTCPELAGSARAAVTQPVAHPPVRPPVPVRRPDSPATTLTDQPVVPPSRALVQPTYQPPGGVVPRGHDAQLRPIEERSRSKRKRWIIVAAALLVLATFAGLVVGRAIIRSNYYVADYGGTVAVMRGIQGSFFGLSLHEPHLQACLNARDELSLVSVGQRGNPECQPLKVGDLRPAARAHVRAGLPGGSLDGAISQLRSLTSTSLLPPCGSVTSTSPSASVTTATTLPPPPPQPGVDCRAA